MIKLYNWLICKLFKRCELETKTEPQKKTNFEIYCELNPSASECKIYEV